MLDSLFPRGSRHRKLIRSILGVDVKAPAHLAAKFRDVVGLPTDVDLDQEEPTDLEPGRLAFARRCVAPWLDRARTLNGARILEIGCGTGASTIALAEQGARVCAIDVDEPSIEEAKRRCASVQLDVEFNVVNATEIGKRFHDRKFDFIIYYASLEHMTHEERLATLRTAWGMLSPGALLCITGTPNRLWWFDSHTAYLPFYFWLPDDLAFAYAQFSRRKNFHELYTEPTAEKRMHFLRRGRGLSFHELDLAIMPAERLKVVSSLNLALRRTSIFNRLRWNFSAERRYERILQRARPDLHPGFFTKYLNMLIEKTNSPTNL